MQNEVKTIVLLAQEYHDFRSNETHLFDRINKLSSPELKSISSMYTNAGNNKPINNLRRKIVERLSKNTQVTQQWVEEQKKTIEAVRNKKSFQSYNSFSILFPLLRKLNNHVDVKNVLDQLGNSVIQELGISSYVKSPHVVNFWGSRGFGTDRAWMAIYNDTHPNQSTAKQLFFLFDTNGLFISFYDRYNETHIQRVKIDLEKDYLKEIVQFFLVHLNDLRKNKFSELKTRKLGVLGANVFKLSHGASHFDKEEIQYCIVHNIIVVNEYTKGIGTQNFSQYELFQKASIGDVFYLTWGNNHILLIGQFVDNEINDYSYKKNEKGWKQRNYLLLFTYLNSNKYSGKQHWWSPSGNSTFVQINEKAYAAANEKLFIPFFGVELDNSQEVVKPQINRGIATGEHISIHDKEVDPKLDINILSKEFGKLIHNLKSENGQFLGIFGRWGRGKTYFAEQVFKQLKDGDYSSKHKAIIFNAWKHQDSNAIWAYIYEVLKEEYLNLSNGTWYRRLLLILKLNIARKGLKMFWILVVGIVLNLSWILIVPAESKKELTWWIISNLGLLVVIRLLWLYKNYSPRVKGVYREYTKSHGYKSELGLQTEIQEEIKILLKTWFGLRTKMNRGSWYSLVNWNRDYDRLIFFVDDIDRCNEDRIIRVIDSLRVMLEDKEIVERIIVLAAIDESILKTAIEWKYKDLLIFKDPTDKKQDGDNKRNLDITTREYMDKLFIGGLKLPKLLETEQYTILENYALTAKILEIETDEPETKITPITESEFDETVVEDDFIFPQDSVENQIIEQSEYFLLQNELKRLHESIKNSNSVELTPRQLRIYLNRYLLAKNIAASFLLRETGDNVLTKHYGDFLIDNIANKTVDLNHEIDTSKLTERNINPKLIEFTPKLIEMVVPY